MSNYATLKSTINTNIKTNGSESITGTVLNSVLTQMVTSLAGGYLLKGIATPSTNPGSPDQNVFYIAGEGSYTYFGGQTVQHGEIAIFKYNGSWTKETLQSAGGVANNRAGSCGITVKSGVAVADCPVGDYDELYVELTQNVSTNRLSLDMDFTSVPNGFIHFDMYVYNGSDNQVTLKTRYNSTTDTNIPAAAYYAGGNMGSSTDTFTMASHDLVRLSFIRLATDSPSDLYYVHFELMG